jgi:hypothetical protein
VRVRFWTIQTGLQPQLGTVLAFRTWHGFEEAEIAPDDGGAHIYLFCGAVWGYEPIEEKQG